MTIEHDLITAARRVLTDRTEPALTALELALARRDVAMLMDHNTTLWQECHALQVELGALRAQLDDAERERSDYAAAVDAHRDRIAELERECGELAGRIGGLEYDLGAAALEAANYQAEIEALTTERDLLAGRVATLERQAAAPPDLSPRLAGAATAARQVARAIDAPLDPCPHCGQQTFKSQISRTQHVNYCPKNPARLRAPNSKAERDAKRAAALAAPPEAPAEPDPAPTFGRGRVVLPGKPPEQHAPWASDADAEIYRCPECQGTAFAKALRADRCVNCDTKARIGRAA